MSLCSPDWPPARYNPLYGVEYEVIKNKCMNVAAAGLLMSILGCTLARGTAPRETEQVNYNCSKHTEKQGFTLQCLHLPPPSTQLIAAMPSSTAWRWLLALPVHTAAKASNTSCTHPNPMPSAQRVGQSSFVLAWKSPPHSLQVEASQGPNTTHRTLRPKKSSACAIKGEFAAACNARHEVTAVRLLE